MDVLIAVRTTHLAASVLLAGAFAFVLLMLPAGREDAASMMARAELRHWLVRACRWAGAVSLVSWVAWLFLVASSMSGGSLEQSLSVDVLGTVLTRTTFGAVWMLRFAVLVALAALLWRWERQETFAADARYAAGACLAVTQLMTLAGTGHAVATAESLRPIHIAADALHLLGAGAWLGALVPLLFVLRCARNSPAGAWHSLACIAVRRFSALGVPAVLALLLTGLINAFLLVGSVPALFDTAYGRLLAVKVILFVILVSVAAFNRLRLAPKLRTDGSPDVAGQAAVVHLWRNVMSEVALGAAVLAIVGALGATAPPSHSHSMPQHHRAAWRREPIKLTIKSPCVGECASVVASVLNSDATKGPLARGG